MDIRYSGQEPIFLHNHATVDHFKAGHLVKAFETLKQALVCTVSEHSKASIFINSHEQFFTYHALDRLIRHLQLLLLTPPKKKQPAV
jgi:hypothetical protein